MCGSSYLNERFEKLLNEKLEGEDYLETNNMTIKGIIDMKAVEFENKIKRSIDVTSRNREAVRIFIPGLLPNQNKRFTSNRLLLRR